MLSACLTHLILLTVSHYQWFVTVLQLIMIIVVIIIIIIIVIIIIIIIITVIIFPASCN